MDLGLRGKAVLVTGATRGIGRAIALAYAHVLGSPANGNITGGYLPVAGGID